MVVPAFNQNQAYNGGQMTDLPVFSGAFDGTELFEVVAPGNVDQGINYSINSTLLASLLVGLSLKPVIIANGQFTSPGSPYVVPPGVNRVYVDKTAAEATYIQLGATVSALGEPLIREVAGTAGNTITVSFTGGEEADGNATVPIQSAYGGYFFRPISALGQWTLGVG